MGFSDKLKEMREKAQQSAAEHREQLHDAIDAAGVAANQKTRGRHAARIAKFGDKAGSALDKFAGSEDAAGAAGAAATGDAPASEGPPATAPPPSHTPPPSGPPPDFD
jgi:hypothetical protein